MIQHFCSDASLKIIDTCGDHASPRHFHEYLTDCLTSRTSSGGSSRLGTAADGRGIYGKYGPGDTLPTLDACGATNTPTPDSNGASVVHYHAQAGRPFFLACYTNTDASTALDECRALYAECGRAAEIVTITTVYGSGQYNKCLSMHSNQRIQKKDAAQNMGFCLTHPHPTPVQGLSVLRQAHPEQCESGNGPILHAAGFLGA